MQSACREYEEATLFGFEGADREARRTGLRRSLDRSEGERKAGNGLQTSPNEGKATERSDLFVA